MLRKIGSVWSIILLSRMLNFIACIHAKHKHAINPYVAFFFFFHVNILSMCMQWSVFVHVFQCSCSHVHVNCCLPYIPILLFYGTIWVLQVSVAPGGRWNRFKTYSTIQRTLEIWGFVLTFITKAWLNNQKFSYRGQSRDWNCSNHRVLND